MGGWSAYLGGDGDEANRPSVGVKVRSPSSTKCLGILKSDEGANFWGDIFRDTEKDEELRALGETCRSLQGGRKNSLEG